MSPVLRAIGSACLIAALVGCSAAPPNPPPVEARALPASELKSAPVTSSAPAPLPSPAPSTAPSAAPSAARSAPPRPRQSLKERAVSVDIVAGDVIARDAHGNTAALTTEGKDDEPTLSPDGKSVAFVRHPQGGGNDLYRVPVTDGDAVRLVAAGPLDPPDGVDMVDISNPLFSLDGKRVLFAVTNGRLGAVCGVELATKKVTWLATAIEAELLRKGPYRGHLLIAHRSDSPSGGFIERCEVWDSVKGKLIRAIPCGDEANLTDPGARRALGLDPADPERSRFGLH